MGCSPEFLWKIQETFNQPFSPFQFSAKSARQVIVDPTDIKIFETTPEGDEIAADIDPADGGQESYEDDERGGWGNKLDFLFRDVSRLKMFLI